MKKTRSIGKHIKPLACKLLYYAFDTNSVIGTAYSSSLIKEKCLWWCLALVVMTNNKLHLKPTEWGASDAIYRNLKERVKERKLVVLSIDEHNTSKVSICVAASFQLQIITDFSIYLGVPLRKTNPLMRQ